MRTSWPRTSSPGIRRKNGNRNKPDKANALLESIKPFAPNASVIGEVVDDHKTLTQVVDGYETYVPPLTGEILPRIC